MEIKMNNYLRNFLSYAEENKKQVSIVTLLLIIVLSFYFCIIKTPAFAVIIDGKECFITKDKQAVFLEIAELEKAKKAELGDQVQTLKEVQYKRVFVNENELIEAEKISEYLQRDLHFKVKAVAITVNEQPVAWVNNQELAEKILEELKEVNVILSEGETLKKVEFEEKIAIVAGTTTTDKLLTPEQALGLITTGVENPQTYKVKEGDSLWLIARNNDMYVDDILKANNLKEDDVLSLDQELVLVKSKPYINVVAQVEGQRNEKIPYDTKVETDKNSRTAVKIKQEGQEGEKYIAYSDVRRNGVVEKRDILEEKIIKEKVDKVIVKGTQVIQVASRSGSSVGNGNLSWPVHGSITQYYKGSAHTGVDIATKLGTPLLAADSGVVTFAGYQGGYGRFIIVNHGNGIITRYAHCNSLKAAAGQKVARGEVIATLGSTGRSTGPHLHFEVINQGSFVNPLNYLR
jgi:murein DD-endopeptidase MepM/ murein hydrolase activator NlpD/Na+-transporting NADH:ubiquinone oxidoreductase subunit NqrC